ncbi:MAG: SDR family oxidoreductase [Candidatus Latescibacteria bacterium]|nr:SDR family oxidoreductase [Candidatus Latescibacterota bacterium]MBT4140677.1 SDR family oxidoreductase [Candidatus Latescibacterota bacterium]MBT5830785.1 SDR family oxidoreductase [Candidatus Latescibacterota bacterium]
MIKIATAQSHIDKDVKANGMADAPEFQIEEPATLIREGMVALVTGAGSGVGAVVARELGRRGVKVALVGRRSDKLEETAHQINLVGGMSQCFPGDVSLETAVDELKAQVKADLGDPDILVNAAGLHCELVSIEESTPQLWKQTLDVNLFGCYLTCRAFVGAMKEKGWGRILNITSASSLHPPTNIGSIYSLSKVALNHFTRQLAKEVEGHGVTANVIHPGEVQTEMWQSIKTDAQSRSGPGKNALNWVEKVSKTGGDPPEKTAELILRIISGDADEPNGQFLWIRDGLKEPMPSW